jgi:hypothetical protein
LTLRRHFGDNEGVIELNPHGAEAPLPLVKQGGENIWATGRGDPGEAGKGGRGAVYAFTLAP